MKDLELQLSEMHDELDQAKKSEVINTEKELLLQVRKNTTGNQESVFGKVSPLTLCMMDVYQDLAQLRADFQEMQQAKEEQEEVLHHRERELSALKGALKEEVETHDKYISALKEEYELELEKLLGDLQQAKEVKLHIFPLFLYICNEIYSDSAFHS